MPPPTPEPISPELRQTHFSWFRTRLSVERTYMSWVRTATSLIGFGFTIFNFLRQLDQAGRRPEAPKNFGLAFIGVGLFAMALGLWQRYKEVKYLSGDEDQEFGWRPGLPEWKGSNLIGAVVLIIGLTAFIWVFREP